MFNRPPALFCLTVIGLAIFPGCQRESSSVATNLKTWGRAQFEPGGGEAMVLYFVYGSFTNEFKIDRTAYRTEGVPKGFSVRKLSRAQKPVLPFTAGDFAKLLRQDNSNLFMRIEQSAECVVIQGKVADPPDLNYLRDCVGEITYLMERGGVAVTDAQQLRAYGTAQWRREFFEPEAPRAHLHVAILVSAEESGGRWFHTRGMRKFGRPDLSLHNVPENLEKAAVEMCNRFIELQATGGRISEGYEIRMASLPAGLVCHHKGSLDDPHFNNVHVEIQFAVDR